ncbi:HNH endonuclease [Priestia megaterium]|uniref:HNH endonuclease n=1 Tax=Priestia megaterium TaxID=1404 RepID=UPI00196B7702|nr:HNH endonuclease [Priestia megaterium]QSF41527.1 HNH endonuclease [Priestia megaterium]
MSKVILQPTGSAVAKLNYQTSVLNTVELKLLRKYLSKKEVIYLENIYGNCGVPVWGVIAGVGNRNKKYWERINEGDVALFAGNNKIFSSATITHKLYNKQLAIELWGWKEGVTWECIYFLDEIRHHNIRIQEFNRLLGYKLDNPIRGFRILDEERSLKVLEYFNFKSDKYFSHISEEEYKEVIKQYMSADSLDVEIKRKLRKEQAFLRRFLFGNKKRECCGICGDEYPVEFLVAAHIKKRAECTEEERLDYEHIVMPMCSFGCDSLYEKGIISVKNGAVQLIYDQKLLTFPMRNFISKIEGRQCEYWSQNTIKYFNWHQKYHGERI